ncbi:hypothetical protein J3459_013677 [Metarhizium acridum]|uniref:uncharacterized protein n=1 Tax=Metarhizium acridum TaxID=92637 RepID=UPI001C6B4E5D|nr:hypothetical protein J3459_013677 [Metarhizium acridum]KAG8421877.1 hypothetical protein J3458_003713 [Metarhizium acridum]
MRLTRQLGGSLIWAAHTKLSEYCIGPFLLQPNRRPRPHPAACRPSPSVSAAAGQSHAFGVALELHHSRLLRWPPELARHESIMPEVEEDEVKKPVRALSS